MGIAENLSLPRVGKAEKNPEASGPPISDGRKTGWWREPKYTASGKVAGVETTTGGHMDVWLKRGLSKETFGLVSHKV